MNCASCHGEIPDVSNFCPGCGKPKQSSVPVGGTAPSPGLAQNIAGALAYITFIPAIVFLVLEPYNKNNFVRFHAFQSIFFAVATTAIQMGLHIVGSFLSLMPFMALLLLPVYGLVGLGFFILWIVCLVKAFNNEKFKLPIIGKMAEQQAVKG